MPEAFLVATWNVLDNSRTLPGNAVITTSTLLKTAPRLEETGNVDEKLRDGAKECAIGLDDRYLTFGRRETRGNEAVECQGEVTK